MFRPMTYKCIEKRTWNWFIFLDCITSSSKFFNFRSTEIDLRRIEKWKHLKASFKTSKRQGYFSSKFAYLNKLDFSYKFPDVFVSLLRYSSQRNRLFFTYNNPQKSPRTMQCYPTHCPYVMTRYNSGDTVEMLGLPSYIPELLGCHSLYSVHQRTIPNIPTKSRKTIKVGILLNMSMHCKRRDKQNKSLQSLH